jgi:ABC-type nitrate/sulfonate/bicarbonate transport system substrate-binding protein
LGEVLLFCAGEARCMIQMSVTEGAGIVMAWPALCARAFGHYERAGLDVELLVLSESEATAGLRSGEVPIARRGADPHLEVIDAGAPVRIIAGLCAKPPLYLYARPDIRSIAALRGETVAGVPGRSASALYLRMVLAEGGLAEADCVYRDVGRAANRMTALRSGEVAAGLLSPPASAQAAAEGFSLVCALPAAYPQLPYTVLEANLEAASADRAAIVALLRAEIRALRWLLDPANEAAAVAELADVLGVAPVAATAAYGEMVRRDRVYSVDGAVEAADLAQLIDAFRRYASTEFASPPAAYLEPTFLAAAQREVGPPGG